MTQFDLINQLHELNGGLRAAYMIADADSNIEAVLDNLERQVVSLIQAVKDNICCTTHFVTGGVCGGGDEPEHFEF